MSSNQREKQQLGFYELLERMDHGLAASLQRMKEIALMTWIECMTQDKGSHTGWPHLRNVEINANDLVPFNEKETFSPGEIFLLLASILLHDIGKAKSDPRHALESEKIINDHWAVLGLPDQHLAKYCGLVAFSHGSHAIPGIEDRSVTEARQDGKQELLSDPDFRDTSLSPYGKLRIPLLATILRVSDETENAWTRALSEPWRSFQRDNPDPQSNAKGFRALIENLEFCHRGRCIIIYLSSDVLREANGNSDVLRTLMTNREGIQEVLANWRRGLTPIDVSFKHVLFQLRGKLYNNLSTIGKPPQLHEVFQDGTDMEGKEGKEPQKSKIVQNIAAALKELFHGTCGHTVFRYGAIGAQLRRDLTDEDIHIIENIRQEDDKFEIQVDAANRKIHVVYKD